MCAERGAFPIPAPHSNTLHTPQKVCTYRAEGQEALEEVEPGLAERGPPIEDGPRRGEALPQRAASRLPKVKLAKVWERVQARPALLVGRAQQLKDLAQLVDLALAGQQRLAREELAHDAAHAPDIHRRRVRLGT